MGEKSHIDTSHDNIQVKDKTSFSKSKWTKWLIGTLIFVSILVLFVYLGTIEETIVVNQNVSKTSSLSVSKNLTDKISFSDYLEDIYATEGKEIALQGILRKDLDPSNAYVFYVVDDYGNQVLLEGTYNEMNSYLPQKGDTQELYSIEGVFGRNYRTLYLNVNKISPYERPIAKTVQETVEVATTEELPNEIKQAKYPLIRNLLYKLLGKEITCAEGTEIGKCSTTLMHCSLNGLEENPSLCGCPAGQRVYSSKCIPENKCSDGTMEYACSPTQKKQCINGQFIYNPNLCGCPENYIQKENTCVKACDESASYGDCPKPCANVMPLTVPKSILSVFGSSYKIESSNFNKGVRELTDTNIWKIESNSPYCYAGKYPGQFEEKIYCDGTVISRFEKTATGAIENRWYTALTSEWDVEKDSEGKIVSYTFDKFACENGKSVVMDKGTTSYYVYDSREGYQVKIEY